MSSGQQSWADDCREEYYKENKDKDLKTLEDYKNGEEYRRLIELRKMFKEYREWKWLEDRQDRVINKISGTIPWSHDSIREIEMAGNE
jgi:hypothetical protein